MALADTTPTERQSLRAIPLPDERLWIALPSGHALAARKLLRLDDLRNEPFILYPRANGSLLYDSIIVACQSAGFSPRVVQEAPQMASMVSLVAAGVGVTLVPESVCQLRPAGVRYVRINGQAPAGGASGSWHHEERHGIRCRQLPATRRDVLQNAAPADDLNESIRTKYQFMTFYILDVCDRRRYSRSRRCSSARAGHLPRVRFDASHRQRVLRLGSAPQSSRKTIVVTLANGSASRATSTRTAPTAISPFRSSGHG